MTGGKRAYQKHTSPSRSTLVLAFCLIGALPFHFTDCPHKRRALGSNSNHFPIMQIISPQKSSTPGAHQFSEASSLNTCIFFFSPLPPTSSLHTYEKNVYFWCTALVFILLWWGIERALTQSIYTTPFEEYAFFQWWGVKLYKCMGNTSCKKVSCAHTAMGCLEWHYHSQCIHRTSTYK